MLSKHIPQSHSMPRTFTWFLPWVNMADWEEIKRLAADFQRAQLSSTIQKYVL